MKHMEIFEQAMCCPTGLCGPSIDPELLRVSTVLDTLKQHGIDVGRYNLTSAPLKFVQTKAVTDFLQHHGPEDLPLILVDGTVQFAGRYPTNDEFASLIGFDPAILEAAQAAGESCCCGDSAEATAFPSSDAPAESEASSCCCGDAPAEPESSSCCCGGDCK
ncbi:arsenic resistance operon repressor [Megasphaera elsdenii 14-14]|nr:arsenic resistance operon repressor [Megasphaera elsdenii 14-14]